MCYRRPCPAKNKSKSNALFLIRPILKLDAFHLSLVTRHSSLIFPGRRGDSLSFFDEIRRGE
jgi:hypothetical protein